jgi:hypothetical protein
MRRRPRRVAHLFALAVLLALSLPSVAWAWGPFRRPPPKPAAIQRSAADVPLPPSDAVAPPAPPPANAPATAEPPEPPAIPPPPPAAVPAPGAAGGMGAGIGGPPAPVPPPPPAAPEPPPAAEPPPAPQPDRLTSDELRDPGYVPGYKTHHAFGPAPWVPTVGALPGGITPGFQAPMPANEWTFKWTGYMSATAMASINERPVTGPGQSKTVFHIPPSTPDEYQSFVGTATMPGQWIAMNFRYGNKDVSANVTLSTWNPTQPTTFYQLGSQGFVNNAYLAYNLPAIRSVKLRARVGYFYDYHGNLGQYGPGVYQMPIVGGARGVGESIVGELSLSPKVTLTFEQGIMGDRSGRPPAGNVPANPNYAINPLFPAAYVAHFHAGVIVRGEYTLRANVHYMHNWAQDDRVQTNCFLKQTDTTAMGTFGCTTNADNMVTRGVNERYIPDSRISVVGADATVTHNIYGMLGAGASHIDANHAAFLRGLLTFGGEGQHIAERWLGLGTGGPDLGGTGTIDAVAVNYSGSLARIINGNRPFDANGPNLLINAGAVFAVAHTASPNNVEFDGRRRYKFAIDGLYSFLPWLSAGARYDHVVPSSKNSAETFDVLAARLVFKTNWQSRESITLLYAKWFYGSETHPEYSVLRRPWLDDQLVALNVNLWW